MTELAECKYNQGVVIELNGDTCIYCIASKYLISVIEVSVTIYITMKENLKVATQNKTTHHSTSKGLQTPKGKRACNCHSVVCT